MEIKVRNIVISDDYLPVELPPSTIHVTEWFRLKNRLYFKVDEHRWKPLFSMDILEIKIKGNVIYRQPKWFPFDSSPMETIISSLDFATQKILVKYKGCDLMYVKNMYELDAIVASKDAESILDVKTGTQIYCKGFGICNRMGG